MAVSVATRKTMAKHRQTIKNLEMDKATLEYRIESLTRRVDEERQAHTRTKAQQQGFREGVEFAVRAMIREITTWKGSES